MSVINAIIDGIRNSLSISNEQFIENLKQKGAKIGKGVYFFSPRDTIVDQGKAFLISIGDYCKITRGVIIIAHDYSRSVTRYVYGDNIGGCAPVKIGNNCFIGINSIILMGTTIGDNCIIGTGSVVKGIFPAGCVIAGNPAKVICSIEEYREKRKGKVLYEAYACVKACKDNTGKEPTVKQMGDGHAWLYLPHTEETIRQYPAFFELSGDNPEKIKRDFLATKPLFNSFEDFLKSANAYIKKQE